MLGSTPVVRTEDSREESLKSLRTALAALAASMEMVRYNREEGTGPIVPGEPLFIFADADAPARSVVDVIESCRMEGILIWSLRFAFEGPAADPAFLRYELPREVGLVTRSWIEHRQLEVSRIDRPAVLCWREIDGEDGPEIARLVRLEDASELRAALEEFDTSASWSFSLRDAARWEELLKFFAVFADSPHQFVWPGECPPVLESL